MFPLTRTVPQVKFPAKFKIPERHPDIYFRSMPTIDLQKAGSFCWIELATTDQNAAKQFYGSLFGWSAVDMPMAPGEFYSMFKLAGHDAGAAYTLRAEQRAGGVPPHWTLYILVKNTDETAQLAAKSGATILMPPMDVMEQGRMAVLKDPAGASICIWQPKQHSSALLVREPGSICWADLNTPDPQGAQRFYTTVFGWEFIASPHTNPPYLQIKNGDDYIGGIPPCVPPANVPAHWMAYFLVTDCDASSAKAIELGGSFCLEPMNIEHVGRMSILKDPQGAFFALFQPQGK
jgi:predicted enzyme related to lactoylglutathione lyase